MKRILCIVTCTITVALLVCGPAFSQGILSNLFNYRQNKQVINIATSIPDTVNAATEDSCSAWFESDYTLPSEYSNYLVVEGNGSASMKKATFSIQYYPTDTKGNNLTFWAKASDDTITVNRIDVWFAYGDSTVVAEQDSIVLTEDDTWEKITIPMTRRMTNATHSLVIKVYCTVSNRFYISPFYVE